jgi:hypothetical protein
MGGDSVEIGGMIGSWVGIEAGGALGSCVGVGAGGTDSSTHSSLSRCQGPEGRQLGVLLKQTISQGAVLEARLITA